MSEARSSYDEGDGESAFGRLLDVIVPSRQGEKLLLRQNARLESFLRSVPLEYCGWDAGGAQAVSPGFAALLGVSRVERFENVESALSPGDAAALAGLYERLNRYGEHFELGVQVPASGKSLRISGKRGESFSVLWVMDVTDFAQATRRNLDAAAQVERREAELRAMLNAMPFPVWTRDENLDLSWCNKFYARTVDDTAAAVVADQRELPVKPLPPGRGAGQKAAQAAGRVLAQKAMAKLTPQSARGHMIVEGSRRLVEAVEIPLPAEKRMVGVALDVTREEELEMSSQQLADSHREVLEQLRTAVATFDQDTRLDFYNSAYEQLTGLSGQWLDTRPRITEIIDRMRELRRLPEQADFKQFKQAWLARFTSLLEPYEEMQYLPDGTVQRLVALPRPMGGLMLTLEDVTSRLRLETSYNTLIAVQRETMNNLTEGISVFGEDGKLRLSNDSFARIWRLAPESLEGAPHITKLIDEVRGLFADDAWQEARQTMLACALERAPRKGRLLREDGAVLEYSVVPLPDGNILNTWFDITDTVKVEQVLAQKNAALREAERLKSDFLANVSYQLRTPLNAIMGFTEMLDKQYFGSLNERQAEYTAGMLEAGRRLVSLINDILDLSTIEAGYMELHPAPVRVRSVIDQVAELTATWAQKQKLDIAVECPDPALEIVADERRVKQVLLNLISNAINYSPGGGRVVISARAQGQEALLSVRDHGLGIPEKDLARIFTPFEQIRDQKARRRGGAGLGLALVKSIAEMHGGYVAVESVEGKGTTVTVHLPLRAP